MASAVGVIVIVHTPKAPSAFVIQPVIAPSATWNDARCRRGRTGSWAFLKWPPM